MRAWSENTPKLKARHRWSRVVVGGTTKIFALLSANNSKDKRYQENVSSEERETIILKQLTPASFTVSFCPHMYGAPQGTGHIHIFISLSENIFQLVNTDRIGCNRLKSYFEVSAYCTQPLNPRTYLTVRIVLIYVRNYPLRVPTMIVEKYTPRCRSSPFCPRRQEHCTCSTLARSQLVVHHSEACRSRHPFPATHAPVSCA